MSYSPKFILRTCLFVTVVAFVIGYTLFQAQNLILGPVITLNLAHADTTNIPSEVMLIKGSAKNISFITFNGRQIYTDKEGQFSENVLLSEGFNVVKITGQDRFGRTVDKTLELVLKESEDGYALTVNNEVLAENNRL